MAASPGGGYLVSMSNCQTIGELFKAGRVSGDQLYTAVTAFLDDPTISLYPLAEGVVINPFAAVKASSPATRMLARDDVSEAAKRNAVRLAVLVSRMVES